MSLEQRRTAVTLEMHQRVLAVIRAHKGRATIDQIRDAEVVPGALVQETLRELICRKVISMHGVGTYALVGHGQAELAQLAGPLAVESTEQSGRTAREVDATSGGPAEPSPRRRGRPKQGGTETPSKAIECLRCHMKFPPMHFAATQPGRRRFRLCAICRDSAYVAPRKHAPLRIEPDLSKQNIELVFTDVLAEYFDQLKATGLYGESNESILQRLLCDAIARLIVGGILKQATGERP